MTEIICHLMDDYFSEITKAVKKNGRKFATSLEYNTMRMVVTFPDRSIKIGMNLIKSMGDTGEWNEQLFVLPTETIAHRTRRINNKNILPSYTEQIQKAVEDGENQRR
jgi:hypothetical protein